MSCSPFDLRDFLLQELADPQQRQVENHIQACLSCRQELDRLRLTQTALSCLVEEEIPQRIAFVSDKIFEPSPWRRGWSAFWGSAARLGFASAAMLSIALVVSPVLRPTRRPAPVATISDAEIRQRIEAGVTHAVADIEARYSERTEQLVKDIRRRDDDERHAIQKAAADDIDYLRRVNMDLDHRVYSAQAAGPQGEPK